MKNSATVFPLKKLTTSATLNKSEVEVWVIFYYLITSTHLGGLINMEE
jgi:hypothetical protein